MLHLLRLAFCLITFVGVSYGQRAVIVTTDFSTGSLSSLDTQTLSPSNDLLLIHSDAAVRTHGDFVYVLNKLNGDNIIVLQKDNLATPVTQYSTGNGSNPHDIVFASSEKAYVSLYERDYVLIVNPATGDSLGSIDVSAYADEDGIPEISQMAILGDRVFVTAQRLNRDAFFSPTESSLILVIDTQTDTLIDADADTEGVQGIVLAGTNPTSVLQRGTKLIISTVASFGAQDGGIEIVDLISLQMEGQKVSEESLAGDVGAMAMLDDTTGYIVVSDANFVSSVKRFDLSTGVVSDTLPDHSGGFTPSLALKGSSLWVLDRGTFSDPSVAGVVIYDTSTNTRTSGPIGTGLPPSDIEFVDLNPADFNDDGNANFDDFLLFAAAFGKQPGDDAYGSQYDLDPNGMVDFTDFLIFAENFGQ
ncbi:MAG: hypothetical protein CME19_13960 [Gemmatimonadetes bacterium]|nr:hypothetical protein [Gemmatimonadota bacterium]